MAGFGDIPAGLARQRPSAWAKGAPPTAAPASRLQEISDFGANPGALRMLAYAPPGLAPGAPLVVVLHGCTQTADAYESHAGWTRLADRDRFAVVYPEQKRSNNPQGCFNWFLPADTARGLGETRSIREMIDTAITTFSSDRGRVFVTGLSAGGAMASALLADYPEVFAGGAIIAGLPCGAAASLGEAFEAMSRPAERSAPELGDRVRAASTHKGPWPKISIWHGGADSTVAPTNAEALARQWTDVHGVALEDFREEMAGTHRRRVWSVAGQEVVELTTIPGMGHGTPLDGAEGERKGPFMLDVGLSSTRRIAAFWGVSKPQAAASPATRPAALKPSASAQREPANPRATPRPAAAAARPEAPPPSFDVGSVISRALKAAGLMK